MRQTGISSRRVAFVVAILAAALFVAGLTIDVIRASRYRQFFVINDASSVVLFSAAAVYLRWGRRIAMNWYGRFAGRIVQGYALLAFLSQALIWVRVARRNDVWWALIFLVPTAAAAGLAIASVHLAIRDRLIDASGAETGADV